MKNICSKILNILLKLGKGLLTFLAVVGSLAAIYYGIDFAFKELLPFITVGNKVTVSYKEVKNVIEISKIK